MIETRFINPGDTLRAIASESSSGFYAIMFSSNSNEEDIIKEVKRIKSTNEKPDKQMCVIINDNGDNNGLEK
jgi:hypothetical protein